MATSHVHTPTVRGSGCSVCSNRRVEVGFNDLPTTRPDLAGQWDDERDAQTVTKGSTYKARWVCADGHRWVASVVSRSRLGAGCPFCAGRLSVRGETDLATLFPVVAQEWAEPDLSPSDVRPGYAKKVLWRCAEGHEWRTTPNLRTSKGTGCPECYSRVSRGEQEVADFLRALGHVVEQSRRDLIPPKELDVYLPEFRLAVEFNGTYWHSEARGRGEAYHEAKTLACEQENIRLIHVAQHDWENDRTSVEAHILTQIATLGVK